MTGLVAEASIPLADPAALADRLCEHLAEHDVVLARDGTGATATFPFGTAWLRTEGGMLHLRAEAADLEGLHDLRVALAAHVGEFAAREKPAILWTGDGSALRTPPDFRMLQVAAVQTMTPHMRRITFTSLDLARFATDAHLHVRLLFPTRDGDPEWPSLGRDGLVRWPERGGLASRRYTIRRHDLRAGTIEIDFVLHADAGPGSGFAARARQGDRIGMLGPGGGSAPLDRDWYLLAGDETALPAIARILETLPTTARGVAVIEVANAAECQTLIHPARVAVRWILRDRATPGAFVDAVCSVPIPRTGETTFAWIGCEFEDFLALRDHMRAQSAPGKAHQLVVAYWRRGHGEDEAA